MSKHTILFLAANPFGTDRLALDEEARTIQQALERSGHRDQFELVTRWAVQPLDMLQELRKLKPTIVHFSGHGGPGTPQRGDSVQRDVVAAQDDGGWPTEGLIFQDADGRPQLVSTAALARVFGAAGGSVKLVVLNACYSDAQATSLIAHVDAVVGMAGAIGDAAARAFAVGFYGGLGEGESVLAAYEQAYAAIGLDDRLGRWREQITFRVRDGFDAESIMLAGGGRHPRSGSLGALQFAVIGLGERRSLSGRTENLKFSFDGVFPTFDITLVNEGEGPVVATAIGLEVITLDFYTGPPDPEIGPRALSMPQIASPGMPTAGRVRATDHYVIVMAHVNYKAAWHAARNWQRNWLRNDLGQSLWHELPDPVYFEPLAPYRFELTLESHWVSTKNVCTLRLAIRSNCGVSHSDRIELWCPGFRQYRPPPVPIRR